MENESDPDRLRRLFRVIQGGVEAANNTSAPPPAHGLTAQINYGSQNVQISGDIHLHAGPVVKKVQVRTGENVVSAAQKQILKELVLAWVDTHNAVKRRQLSFGAAWSRFHRRFRVNAYGELPAERFDEAAAWLRQQRAMLDSMKSAPVKDPQWRRRAIMFIKASCKNQLGDEFFYLPYTQRKFGKNSLTELDNSELAAVRTYIISKKRNR